MAWNYLSIPKLQLLYRWSLEIDSNFFPYILMSVITYKCWD